MDTNGFAGNASSYLVNGLRVQLSCNLSLFMACVPPLSCRSVSLTVCLLRWLATIPLFRYVFPLFYFKLEILKKVQFFNSIFRSFDFISLNGFRFFHFLF